MVCSQPSSSVHGILQARILEWIAIPFSRGSSRCREETQVSGIAGMNFTIWATREVSVQYTSKIFPLVTTYNPITTTATKICQRIWATIIAHGKDCSGLQQISAFALIPPQSILNIVTKITLSKCKSLSCTLLLKTLQWFSSWIYLLTQRKQKQNQTNET